MKALWSPLVSQVSGSMGTLTASRNRYGSYLRYRNGPDNSLNQNWQAIRDNTQLLMARWRTLSDELRMSWSIASSLHLKSYSFGNASTLPGYNYYLSVNNNRFICGLLTDDTPPPYGQSSLPDNLSLSSNVSTQSLVLTYNNTLSDVFFTKIFATVPLSPSITYYRNQLRLVRSAGAQQMPSLDISNDYASRFILPFAVGQAIAFKLVNFNAIYGACSEPYIKRFVIAA